MAMARLLFCARAIVFVVYVCSYKLGPGRLMPACMHVSGMRVERTFCCAVLWKRSLGGGNIGHCWEALRAWLCGRGRHSVRVD